MSDAEIKPLPLAALRWIARERARFDSGEYVSVPWADAEWWQGSAASRYHFAHVAKGDPSKLAFTESHAKGEADRQTVIKPGRYLARYFGATLSADEIRDLATEWAARAETLALRLATDEDEIERVYTDGPSSCMGHPAEHFGTPFHPTRVYAAGDLAVAYLERGGEITARALCWPDRGVYARIYGDETRLLDAFYGDAREWRAGCSSDFQGARLLRVEYGNGFVCPYLDVCGDVSDDGKYLRLGGEISARSTDGIAESGEYCSDCGGYISEGDGNGTDDGYLCDGCYSERYTRCDRCHDSMARDDARTVNGDSEWCEDCEYRYAFYCEGCEETRDCDDARTVDGNTVCEGCADSATECEIEGCETYTREPIKVREHPGEIVEPAGYDRIGGHYPPRVATRTECGTVALCKSCSEDDANVWKCEGCDTLYFADETRPTDGDVCHACRVVGSAGYQAIAEREGQLTLGLAPNPEPSPEPPSPEPPSPEPDRADASEWSPAFGIAEALRERGLTTAHDAEAIARARAQANAEGSRTYAIPAPCACEGCGRERARCPRALSSRCACFGDCAGGDARVAIALDGRWQPEPSPEPPNASALACRVSADRYAFAIANGATPAQANAFAFAPWNASALAGEPIALAHAQRAADHIAAIAGEGSGYTRAMMARALGWNETRSEGTL